MDVGMEVLAEGRVMDGCMGGWMNVTIEGQKFGWLDGWMNVWMKGEIERLVKGWTKD